MYRAWSPWLVAVVAFGCGGTTPTPTPPPTEIPDAKAAGTPTAGDSKATPAEWTALRSEKPATDAPEGLSQFGQLVGLWKCTSEQRQQDGSWKDGPTGKWTWFYTLDGRAVQDVWEPAKGAVGTNLRVYDAKADAWEIQWITGTLTKFQHITAKAAGENIVMHSDAPAAGGIPAHASRITFFDIDNKSFEWKYEATKLGTDTGWVEFSRLHCGRVEQVSIGG